MVGMDTGWFKSVLKERDVTEADLGVAVGISRTVISRIINGHQPLTYERAVIFARKLEEPLSEVLRRAGLPVEPQATPMLDDELPEERPLDEDLVLRSIKEVLVYILEEEIEIDPIDTANQIMDLYRQYAEKEDAMAKEPTVIIAGNVFRPRVWRRETL